MRIQLKTRGLVAAGVAKAVMSANVTPSFLSIEVTGLGPDFNEIIAYQMNTYGVLFGNGEDKKGIPFEWLVTHTSNGELAEAGLMNGWPHHSAVITTCDGLTWVPEGRVLLRGTVTAKSLVGLGPFTLTAPEAPVDLWFSYNPQLETPANEPAKPGNLTPAEQMLGAINAYLTQNEVGCNLLSLEAFSELLALIIQHHSNAPAIKFLREAARSKCTQEFGWALDDEGNDFAAFMGNQFPTYTVANVESVAGLKTCANIVRVIRANLIDLK